MVATILTIVITKKTTKAARIGLSKIGTEDGDSIGTKA